jgi:hypothetical protein
MRQTTSSSSSSIVSAFVDGRKVSNLFFLHTVLSFSVSYQLFPFLLLFVSACLIHLVSFLYVSTIRFPAGERDFSLRHSVQTDSGLTYCNHCPLILKETAKTKPTVYTQRYICAKYSDTRLNSKRFLLIWVLSFLCGVDRTWADSLAGCRVDPDPSHRF